MELLGSALRQCRPPIAHMSHKRHSLLRHALYACTIGYQIILNLLHSLTLPLSVTSRLAPCPPPCSARR